MGCNGSTTRCKTEQKWSARATVLREPLQEGGSLVRKLIRKSTRSRLRTFRFRLKTLAPHEWKPNTITQWQSIWSSPFAKSQLQDPTETLSTMTTDMRHDIILMYQTLFSACDKPSPSKIALSPEEELKYNRRVLFLKRLFLCFAVCKLTYSVEKNGAEKHAWPFPLASALCHGGRILIRLDGVSCAEFTNFLMLGDAHANEGDVPSPMFARWAATHAVGLNKTSQLYEQKLKLTNGIQNITDGMKAKHLGLDLPVGGFMNAAPMDGDATHIGPAGVPYRLQKVADGPLQVVFAQEIQHGHLYFRRDDFKSDGGSVSAILLGIENSAPRKENFFGGKHTAAAKKQETSAFGTRKWKDYRKGGQKVPADVGGMHMTIDTTAFEALQNLCEMVKLSKPYDRCQTESAGETLQDEEDLFKDLLRSSDEQAVDVLFRRLNFVRPGASIQD